MRIISGKFKGRRFSPPSNFKARPTTDFAKENLFNVLSNYVEWDEIGSALDLFGGTGGISFELASRGTRSVVCVEKSPVHADFILKVRTELKINEIQIIRSDVFKYLDRCRGKFDFIFADPPYDLPNFADVPALVFGKDLLAPKGVFVLEHSKDYDFSTYPLFYDKRVYGSVNFSIFIKE